MTVEEALANEKALAHENPQAGGGLRQSDHPRVFDGVRMMANVSVRAQHLFEDGYRARWTGSSLLAVRNPQGVVYEVDTAAMTCDCPFFQKYCNIQARSECYRCKHLLGYKRLLSRQRMARLLVALTLLRFWAELDDAPSRQQLQENQELQEKSEVPVKMIRAEELEVTDVAF